MGDTARHTGDWQNARNGEITPPELVSGTFTVSNLGMFGMTAIRPVLNLAQAGDRGRRRNPQAARARRR